MSHHEHTELIPGTIKDALEAMAGGDHRRAINALGNPTGRHLLETSLGIRSTCGVNPCSLHRPSRAKRNLIRRNLE